MDNYKVEYTKQIFNITDDDIRKMHVIEYPNPSYGLTDIQFKDSVVKNGIDLITNVRCKQ